jgi:hypothetical protein
MSDSNLFMMYLPEAIVTMAIHKLGVVEIHT